MMIVVEWRRGLGRLLFRLKAGLINLEPGFLAIGPAALIQPYRIWLPPISPDPLSSGARSLPSLSFLSRTPVLLLSYANQ